MYSKKYNDDSIRNENPAFIDFVIPYLSKEFDLIDLGCGSCGKVVKLAPYVERVAAVDRNKIMVKCAKARIKKLNLKNVELYECDNINTPFASHRFDACTTSLSTWSAAEVHRILKINGYFFIETLAPDDKLEVKQAFGKDELGYRGYLLNQTTDERIKYLQTSLAPFFAIQTIMISEHTTTISRAGFIKLLETTPTVRNFSAIKDKRIVSSISIDDKVTFNERRIIIMSKAREV